MSYIFTNSTTGEHLESDCSHNCDEMLALLSKLTTPNCTLITKLPSGLGLDFEVQKDGRLWVEFYADELSGAFVTMAVAEEILKRAFHNGDKNIKATYADLILKWEE